MKINYRLLFDILEKNPKDRVMFAHNTPTEQALELEAEVQLLGQDNETRARLTNKNGPPFGNSNSLILLGSPTKPPLVKAICFVQCR